MSPVLDSLAQAPRLRLCDTRPNRDHFLHPRELSATLHQRLMENRNIGSIAEQGDARNAHQRARRFADWSLLRWWSYVIVVVRLMNESDNQDGQQCHKLEEAPFCRGCPVLSGEELIGEVSRRESDKQAEQGGGGQQPPVGVFWCIHRFLAGGCASPWAFGLPRPTNTQSRGPIEHTGCA